MHQGAEKVSFVNVLSALANWFKLICNRIFRKVLSYLPHVPQTTNRSILISVRTGDHHKDYL